MAFDPVEAAGDLWALHLEERAEFDRIHEFVKERRGKPKVPDDASDEVKRIAAISTKNVLTLVRDSFAQNLSVVGYKSSSSGEDLPPWAMWKRNRMAARQAEIYVPGLTYGFSYAAAVPDEKGLAQFRLRSPLRMLAAYSDPEIDEWPEQALEIWTETRGRRKFRMGHVYSDEHVYKMTLGEVVDTGTRVNWISPEVVGEPLLHNASHCPVVRYVNRRDEDGVVQGELAQLLTLQEAINNANFDRLIVSRFGAFPQKVIAGWQPSSAAEGLAASARRVWTFEDETVKAQTFAAAAIEPYNALLNEMFEHVAMVAQISPAQVTGAIANVNAEALAAAEANEQRKLTTMRESYGEGHEQLLRLGAEIEGDVANAGDDQAEVVWRDTEARSFGAVVDGVTKLAAQGVPIEDTLHLVPGMSQSRIRDIAVKVQQSRKVGSVMDSIRGAAAAAKSDPEVARLSERTVPAGEVPVDAA
ncbi:phage portal protein [Rhodococcus erythropolis]|uniref:phage portal protein n=1 Tax=Rhodococcus erythropolis TaxID=1833 RepID=UPI001BEB9732|nr:phage portal protein [Rhodococcus erythropolis]MBT2266448.1 phage portal protein [Rhodococcus erythropolis]